MTSNPYSCSLPENSREICALENKERWVWAWWKLLYMDRRKNAAHDLICCIFIVALRASESKLQNVQLASGRQQPAGTHASNHIERCDCRLTKLLVVCVFVCSVCILVMQPGVLSLSLSLSLLARLSFPVSLSLSSHINLIMTKLNKTWPCEQHFLITSLQVRS